ncbi:MAG: hypothetical protein LBP79_03225 [Clostridiales bacterium]|jgi:hypothetical protein|nr:hypothetical protein [Clostridiales bacterium]
MARLTDYIALRIIAFLALTAVLYSSLENFILSLILSAVIVAVASVLYGNFFASKIKKEYMNAENLFRHFLIRGNAFAAEYLCKNIRAEYNPAQIDDYILLERGNSKRLIFPVFKYSKISKDEVLKFYRLAEKHAASEVIIVAKSVERDIFLTARDLNITLSAVKIRAIYRYLKSLDALPPRPAPAKIKKQRLENLKLVGGSVFSPKNGRRLLFSTALTLLVSFITPLKTYYYILSSISFILAALCLFMPERASGGDGVFDIKKKR